MVESNQFINLMFQTVVLIDIMTGILSDLCPQCIVGEGKIDHLG